MIQENTNERKKIMFKRYKSTKGITLVALVITIIILLILSGITISSLTNTGLFKNAQKAKEATAEAQQKEQDLLNQYEEELNKYANPNRQQDRVAVVDECRRSHQLRESVEENTVSERY